MNQPDATAQTSPKPLYAMFTTVADRYDLLNRAMTFGLDQRWRREVAQLCLEGGTRRVLDLCTGTGDLAIELARSGSVSVTGFDYSEPMLEVARQKAGRAGVSIAFEHGDASLMPFEDGSFDAVGISFAFRNLTYKNPNVDKHLAEVLRVIRPGGRFVIVESSQPTSKPIRGMYHAYMRQYVKRLGGLLSGHGAAYAYLSESAARYYTPEQVQDLLRKAGFARVDSLPRMLGAIAIHVARKG